MNATAQTVRHVVIRGRVQGVGYRAFVEDEATARAIDGWVRNRRDGTVEALFAGPAEAVEAMVAVCRKGPFGARVDAVDQRDGSSADMALRRSGETFSVLSTA